MVAIGMYWGRYVCSRGVLSISVQSLPGLPRAGGACRTAWQPMGRMTFRVGSYGVPKAGWGMGGGVDGVIRLFAAIVSMRGRSCTHFVSFDYICGSVSGEGWDAFSVAK